MSKKVVLTQEQADEIELQKKDFSKFDDIVTRRILTSDINGYYNKTFHSISVDDLIKALYIGYEVEPEFEKGQWIYDVTDKNKTVIEVAYLSDKMIHGFWKTRLSEVDTCVAKENARHFTEEEIVKEKERRWWKSHNRDVWEIREDDILEYLDDLYIIDSFDSEKVCLKIGIGRKTNYAEPFDFVKKHFKVVCFADNRKDV